MRKPGDNLHKELGDLALEYFDAGVKEQCEQHLIEFLDFAWHVVDPATPLVHGYPMDAIAAHLEAVVHGHIKRLLITVFPGCSKSSLLSVFFPAWVWGPMNMPGIRFINASYSEHLTIRDNLKCRRVVTHDAYTELWGDRFHLEQPVQAYKFQNNHQGWKLATSVDGTLLGDRCDIFLIDDPNSPKVESEAVRHSTNLWFTETVPDRLNSMTEGKIIVIQQRLHLEDVAAKAIERDYTHLNIPMEYMPRMYVNGYDAENQIKTYFDDAARNVPEKDVFWRDWRVEDGELAWPERWPLKVVDQLKKETGLTNYSAKYQQMPVPRGGSIIKSDWWQLWREEEFPIFEFILATLDTAYTEDRKNDPSGMTVWGVTHDLRGNPRVMLIYAWTDYLEFHSLIDRVITTCTVDPHKGDGKRFPVDRLVIEGKASGLSVMQEIARLVGLASTLGIEKFDPGKYGDKTSRLHAVEHLFQNKMIWSLDKAYAQDVIDQLANFPYAGHDEYVDCTTMALAWLRACGFMPMRQEIDEEIADALAFKPRQKPLYFPY